MCGFNNLLRGRDPGASGARNPHVLPCTFRFLRSERTRLTPARYDSRNHTSSGEYARRQIAVAAVADDGDDDGVLNLLGQLQRSPQRAAGRDAGEDAFLARHPAGGFLCIRLAHIDHVVDTVVVTDLRYILVRPFADAGNLRPFGGLHADDLDGGVLFLEVARAAHDGAGRTHAGDEVGDRTLRVTPDLGAGGTVVGGGIVGGGELVEDLADPLLLHRDRQVARAFHAGLLAHQLQFGTERTHGLLAFDRGILGHEQDELVAAHGRRHRQCDAGVTAGRLDQGVAGLDLAPRLRGIDHRQRRAVLL